MSAVMVEPSAIPLPGFAPEGPTLEQVISVAWADLARHQAVECPVCGAHEMEPDYGAHALPIGGRCSSCGSELR